MEWRNIYRGMLMGTSDVVPGVSGGTIAVVLGIYDRLIEAVNGVFSKEWKKQLGFLIPLAIGIGAAILLLSNLIDHLLENYEQPTMFFFLGLIVGIIPFLLNKADYKRNFEGSHYVLLLISVLLVGSLAFFNTGEPEAWKGSLSVSQYIFLFFSGWLASMAMLLPGVSGSFLLLLIGVYPTVVGAISELQFDRIIVIGLGVLIGIAISGKGINHLFKHYPYYTYAVVTGMVIGSIFVVFPGVPASMVLCLITLMGGLLAAFLLGKVEYE
ncbi:DUF368 domain-containing protein [Pontibacillus salicampi]|uniref:DUF368 domain-containing protein n=1 Tax=Pontibacillus salicampi TaxID=1449801 RepID=A0ABV6LNE1_9BACI